MKRLSNSLLALSILAALYASFAYLKLDLFGLFSGDSPALMWRYAKDFLQPDFSPALMAKISQATLETLAMSAIGTLLASIIGLLLALPAAGRLGLVAQYNSRFVLNAIRAIPELVWAALLVLAAGLGPNAGTLALALHTTGVLGRLFAEALENTPNAPAQALRLAGSSRVSAFCYGTLPGVWPQLLAYSLYRWENNIRMASVLGLVGAGGLGQMLYVSLSLFQQAQAASVILAMLLLVLLVDALSNWARQRWVQAS
jgi:phosphonate transport system permease protein